jgi:hypothetical protein
VSPGGIKVGGVVSTTLTLKDAVPTLPCASVAVQFTVVEPRWNVEVEIGEQGTLAIGPLTRSTAVGDR